VEYLISFFHSLYTSIVVHVLNILSVCPCVCVSVTTLRTSCFACVYCCDLHNCWRMTAAMKSPITVLHFGRIANSRMCFKSVDQDSWQTDRCCVLCNGLLRHWCLCCVMACWHRCCVLCYGLLTQVFVLCYGLLTQVLCVVLWPADTGVVCCVMGCWHWWLVQCMTTIAGQSLAQFTRDSCLLSICIFVMLSHATVQHRHRGRVCPSVCLSVTRW